MNSISIPGTFNMADSFSVSGRQNGSSATDISTEHGDEVSLRSFVTYDKGDLSRSGTLRVIVRSENKEILEQIKNVTSRDPGNKMTKALPLISGLAMEIDPDSLELISVLKSSMGALKISMDGEMKIIEPMDAFNRDGNNRLNIAEKSLGIDILHKMGYKGSGTTIAVIDTGIAPHPDLRDNIIAFKDMINSRDGAENAYDDQGHGTHCAGIAAGTGKESGGKYVGVAPEAKLVGVKVLNAHGVGSNSDIIGGIQWVVEQKQQGKLNVDIISMSLGGGSKLSYKDDPVMQAVEKAVENGISVWVAAGNSGEYGPVSIESPGAAPHVVTVGAADDKGTPGIEDDDIAEFSSIGPTLVDLLPKPDILTYGVNITAPSHLGGYITHSGTSMATPMGAGIAALLKQASPLITPGELKGVVMGSANDFKSLTHDYQGAGLVNVIKSIEKLTGEEIA